MNVFKKVWVGLKLVAKATLTSAAHGEIETSSVDSKTYLHNGTSRSPIVTEAHAQTLTNKTIDADLSTITNIDNADIKAGAAIDASKIADGSVSSTEFQYLANVTSDIQTQLNNTASATALSDHINDTTDAHDASAISNVPSGNLAATDIQGAVNELQGDIDTNATAISNHLSDAVDAHDASAISNVPAGNLAATDVQGALNELQSDIDTRITASSTDTLTNKTIDGDTNTVQDLALTSLKTNVTDANKFLVRDGSGVVVSNTKDVPSGVVVGTTDTQTLSAKTFSDAITATEIATPSNPAASNNKLYFKSGGGLYKLNSSGVEVELAAATASPAIGSATPSSVKTANYTIVSGDNGGTILCDSTGGSFTVTLPDPTTVFRVTVKDSTGSAASFPIEIARFGSELIDGSAGSEFLTQSFQAISFISNGTNWYRITLFTGNAIGGRGLFAGGGSEAGTGTFNVIEYITIATAGNATDFGDLTVGRQQLSSCASTTRGVWGGGFTGATSNVIDYVTIQTAGNATDFGDLSATRRAVTACSSSTRGLFAGGEDNTPTMQNSIDYVTIASAGNATDFGDLTVSRSRLAGCSNSTRGLFGGGDSTGASGESNVIDYVTIASTGNATDFGDLSVARDSLAACSSSLRGIFAGGYTSTAVNVIDYVTIASTGNATDFGDLTAVVMLNAGCSNGHGGL